MLLICDENPRRRQAENPLNRLSRFSKPALIWGFSGIGIVLSAILNVALMHSDYRIAVTSVVVPLVMAVGVVLGWEVEEMQGSMSEFYICQLRSDAPKRLNLHIVRISGDEASLVLGLGQMLAWASNRMYEAVLRGLAFGLVVWPPRLWYLASTVVLVAAVVGLVEGVYPGAWLGVEAYTLITIVSLAAAICFLGAFTRPVGQTSARCDGCRRIHRLRRRFKVVGTKDNHGFISGVVNAFCVDVDVEAAPAGHWHVAEFAKGERPGATSELVHSIYLEKRVCKEVVDWIARSQDRSSPFQNAVR